MCNELPTLESLDNIVSIAENWIKTLPEWQQEIFREGKEIKDVTTKEKGEIHRA